MSDLTWTPDPTTSLRSNDRYLSEAIEPHATPTEARREGVYVIRCSMPDTKAYDTYERLWRDEYDAIPENGELTEIAASDELLYVGASGNVYERLEDHFQSDKRKVALFRVFPPHDIHSLWLDVDDAWKMEPRIARTISRERASSYVWQR